MKEYCQCNETRSGTRSERVRESGTRSRTRSGTRSERILERVRNAFGTRSGTRSERERSVRLFPDSTVSDVCGDGPVIHGGLTMTTYYERNVYCCRVGACYFESGVHT